MKSLGSVTSTSSRPDSKPLTCVVFQYVDTTGTTESSEMAGESERGGAEREVRVEEGRAPDVNHAEFMEAIKPFCVRRRWRRSIIRRSAG